MVKPTQMKKIILSLSIMGFIISCGPSKAQLEARQKQENASKMETQKFFDDGDHSVTVHIVEINGCTWYNYCSPNGNTTIHDPHCTKQSSE